MNRIKHTIVQIDSSIVSTKKKVISRIVKVIITLVGMLNGSHIKFSREIYTKQNPLHIELQFVYKMKSL
jgi:hypothetical protein